MGDMCDKDGHGQIQQGAEDKYGIGYLTMTPKTNLKTCQKP